MEGADEYAGEISHSRRLELLGRAKIMPLQPLSCWDGRGKELILDHNTQRIGLRLNRWVCNLPEREGSLCGSIYIAVTD